MTHLQTANTTNNGSGTSIPLAPKPRRSRSNDVPRIAVGLLFALCVLIAGGILLTPQGALLVIGPISLFALPILASLADFVVPLVGIHHRRWLVVCLVLACIIGGGIVMTVLAQAVVGHIDLVGMFSTAPQTAASHLTAFPFTIPLGALLFVLYLEMTVVSGIPLVTKHRLRDGALVFLGCIALALILYQTLANWSVVSAQARSYLGLHDPAGPIEALDLASIVISIAMWQVLYLFTGGGPLAAIQKNWLRIALANVVVIGLGITTYWLLHSLVQVSDPQIAVISAMVAVGTLVIGVLCGMPAAAPPGALSPLVRLLRFCLAAAVAVGAYLVLRWLGMTFQPKWTVGSLELWIVLCGLNLIGGSIFFYCRILRPLPEP